MEQLQYHSPDEHQETEVDAEILQLPRANFESLDPNELSDTECIALYVSSWRHPSLTRSQVAQAIIEDTRYEEDNPWHTRMNQIATDSPLMKKYDEFIKDDTVAAIADFMIRTKSEARSLATERKAANILLNLQATLLDAHDTSDGIGETFYKMLSGQPQS